MKETRKTSVLIVDDKPENLLAFETLLDDPGLDLVMATSGYEALARVLEHDFAVILLDVQMPEMDGFEVAELIRGYEKTKQIPIIFITALSKESSHVFKGYRSGAVDFLFKPIEPEILKSKVRIFCDLKRYSDMQQKMVEKMRTANVRLRELNKMKMEFLSTASHELRTPLTIIRDYVDLVLEEIPGPLNEMQRECMESALSNCDRLGDLINDLLDMQRLTSGRFKLNRRRLPIADLLKQSHRDMIQRCRSRNQMFDLHVDGDLPDIYADWNSITQVMINLIGNANKFTPENGCISIHAKSAGGMILIEVKDDGPGIKLEDQERIFQSFAQVDRHEGPGFRGTGLGLAISHKIIQLHLGEIGLVSTPGEGSCFSFTVPIYNDALPLQLFIQDELSNTGDAEFERTLHLLKVGETDREIEVLKEAEKIIRKAMLSEPDLTSVFESLGILGILVQQETSMSDSFEMKLEDLVTAEFADTALFRIASIPNLAEVPKSLLEDLNALHFRRLERGVSMV